MPDVSRDTSCGLIGCWSSTESKPPLGEADHVLDNTFVVGDFVWSAQDYLGEVGIGRWFYEGDPTEPMTTEKNQPPTKLFPVHHGGDELYPWRGSDCGNLDLIGDSKPSAHHWNIVWNRGEKLYLAVRQPEDDKKITVVPWGLVSGLGKLDLAGSGRQSDKRRGLFPLPERATLS